MMRARAIAFVEGLYRNGRSRFQYNVRLRRDLYVELCEEVGMVPQLGFVLSIRGVRFFPR